MGIFETNFQVKKMNNFTDTGSVQVT